MNECTYGLQKRLQFLSNIISVIKPDQILDVGCGTATNLTEPLAQKFSKYHFIGIDSDPKSIQFANLHRVADNAQYLVEANAGELGVFNLVIASEVIEHVEDPLAFLNFLKSRLTQSGKVILTLPNGYGPYELVSTIETLMHLTGIYQILRLIKRMLFRGSASNTAADTLAISPHINFFSYNSIRALIESSGFQIVQYQARTFLCGFGFDHLMKSKRLIEWNADVADHLPAQFVSAWMFLLTPTESSCHVTYRRSYFVRFRRYLNEKRWKLK